jgi:hypothetical protein
MRLKEKGPSTSLAWGNKRFCDLSHIFNNDTYNMKEMTTRHSMIQDLLVETIKKHREISEKEALVNKPIDLSRFEETKVMKLERNIRKI